MTYSDDSSTLVSILIPTYEGEEFIAETLQSAISQTYPHLEIIVSDDSSTDKTVEIVQTFREKSPFPLTLLTHERLGMVNNWNFCISQAQGKYIKFLLQDDLLAPNCIEEMVKLAEQDGEIGLVFSPREILLSEDSDTLKDCLYIYDFARDLHQKWSNLDVIQLGQDLLQDPKFFQDPLNKIGEPSTVLIKKTVFEPLGYFDPELKQIVDVDMWTRIMSQYKIAFVNQTLSQFRIHPRQQSVQNSQNHESKLDTFRFYRKLLLDPSYDCLPKSFRHQLYNKIEEYREVLEGDRNDLKSQRDRGISRIKQLEKSESYLQNELGKTQAELEQAIATIRGMESSKFWQMRNAWFKIKDRLYKIKGLVMNSPSKKQLTNFQSSELKGK